MNKEQYWLAQHSPYRLHGTKKQQFSYSKCCGQRPGRTSLEALEAHPKMGIKSWFPVYQCRVCGKWYLWLEGKGKRVDSLLRYLVRERREPEVSEKSGLIF